ncbi:GIY-YIG nuclease family protein [Cupriavidus sp. D384]|uniref:GIY-YIG nuclease family protein n=1 Tax=Cupriavidus sp. D384 TaxID=1538095 RepID=UPI000834CBB0|nr:GIY-YIG nuclease family protein [Cupriavidus sp. D384]
MTAATLPSDDASAAADTNTDVEASTDTPWFLYLLECEGNSIYTGVTTDVQRRYAQHVAGIGAKYTRARKPLRLLGWLAYPNKSEALKAEIRTKRMSAAQKRAMCATLQQTDDAAIADLP